MVGEVYSSYIISLRGFTLWLSFNLCEPQFGSNVIRIYTRSVFPWSTQSMSVNVLNSQGYWRRTKEQTKIQWLSLLLRLEN